MTPEPVINFLAIKNVQLWIKVSKPAQSVCNISFVLEKCDHWANFQMGESNEWNKVKFTFNIGMQICRYKQNLLWRNQNRRRKNHFKTKQKYTSWEYYNVLSTKSSVIFTGKKFWCNPRESFVIRLPIGNSVVKGEVVGSWKNFGNSNYIRVVTIFGRVFNKLQTIKAFWNQSFLRVELFVMQSALDHNLLLWQSSLNEINTGLSLISSKQTENGNW